MRPNHAVNTDADRWRFVPRWSPVTLISLGLFAVLEPVILHRWIGALP
jgi:hypothetical protein